MEDEMTSRWKILIRWLVLSLVIIDPLRTQLSATPPSWWTGRGVLLPGAPANDYAVANLGELRQMALLTYQEMQASLPGGPGSNLGALVNSAVFTGGFDYSAANSRPWPNPFTTA